MNEVSLENCNTATLQQREQSDACIDSAERLQPRQSQQLQQRCKTVEVNVLFVRNKIRPKTLLVRNALFPDLEPASTQKSFPLLWHHNIFRVLELFLFSSAFFLRRSEIPLRIPKDFKLFRSNYTIFVVSRKWSVLGIEHCKPY